MRKQRARASLVLIVLLVLGGTTPVAHAGHVLSPSSPSFTYQDGPFTGLNLAGILLGECSLPLGCATHRFTAKIPGSYYESLRSDGKVGVVRVTLSWSTSSNDFDLSLLDDQGNNIAGSGLGNSDFEVIEFTELPSGRYTIQVTVFQAVQERFRVDVELLTRTPSPSAATTSEHEHGPIEFSTSTPVALERSSGEPNMEIAPNGDIYVDMPLGAPTNGVIYKSTDGGDTFRPLAPLHPNNNPLPTNLAGGGDTLIAIDNSGRLCYSELNTLVSLGIGCSSDGGRSFGVSTHAIDPTTPLVDRQWQAATPQGEQFLSGNFGLLSLGPSRPGIRLFKEVAGTGLFRLIQSIESGRSMFAYPMVADPSDADSGGGTVSQVYVRDNDGADEITHPYQLAVWQTTDGGATVKTYTVANLRTEPGNAFASIAIDRQGNTYVAWIEQGTWDVFYSVAAKGDLEHWMTPVRVNADPEARTALEPTIKVGDRGRVFVGFYGAEQPGNPDALPGGVWHGYVSVSTDGACQLDASPCSSPSFLQTRVTEHPVQHGGICLSSTACDDLDPYYGDRSLLEFLDLEFAPDTGAAHVVVTDSSRTNRRTTITTYRQVSGPSAFAGRPDISGTRRIGTSVLDPEGDAGWPYESLLPTSMAPGADLTSVSLSSPSPDTLRAVLTVSDATAFTQALLAGLGPELLIAVRFATELDVFWVGMRAGFGAPRFEAGHLVRKPIVEISADVRPTVVDSYTADATVHPQGRIDVGAGEITIDVPIAQLVSTLDRPAGARGRPQTIRGVNPAGPLYAVTGFSLVGILSSDDPLAKRLLDVTPAFRYEAAS